MNAERWLASALECERAPAGRTRWSFRRGLLSPGKRSPRHLSRGRPPVFLVQDAARKAVALTETLCFNRRRHMIDLPLNRLAAAVVCLFCLPACLAAEDVATRSGKVLKNAEVLSVEADQFVIKPDGGTERFGAAEFTAETRARLRQADLLRKTAEVEKLKQELARREQELKQIKEDNERLRRNPLKGEREEEHRQREAELQKLKAENAKLRSEQSRAAITSDAPPLAEKPSRPLAELPPLTASDVVDAKDLVLYYKSHAVAADQRFRKKTFLIKGVADKFEAVRFMRRFEVLLDSPDNSIRVVCKFAYANKWNAVYTKERGRSLVAKEGPSELKLLKIGDVVNTRGRCEGMKGS